MCNLDDLHASITESIIHIHDEVNMLLFIRHLVQDVGVFILNEVVIAMLIDYDLYMHYSVIVVVVETIDYENRAVVLVAMVSNYDNV